MRVAEYFDELYDMHERYWWNHSPRYSPNPVDHPTSLVTQQVLRLLEGRPTGRALDLGAGEGADAIRLALLGYEVHAVEISAVGVDKIRRFANEAGVELRVWNDDVGSFAPTGSFDVVLCNGLLHYVEGKESLLRRIQDMTRPDGINAISLWSTYTQVPESHQVVDVYPDDEDGVVVSRYRDWKCELFYLERDKPETSHPDTQAHRHSYIKLIARKRSMIGRNSRADA